MRKLPLLPTIVVALAALTMIGLGIWQLQRKAEKEALLATYAAAAKLPPISWPAVPPKEPLPYLRTATGNCLKVAGFRSGPGQNVVEEPGFVIIADCVTGAEGPGMAVELGWTKNPNAGRDYRGGLVTGTIAPDRVSQIRLVAAEPGPGLQASARPTLDSIVKVTPARHLGYAAFWFIGAIAAVVIYLLALRTKQRETANG